MNKKYLLVEMYTKQKRKDEEAETYGINFTKFNTVDKAIETLKKRCDALIDESDMDAAVRRTKGMAPLKPKYEYDTYGDKLKVGSKDSARHRVIVGNRWPREKFSFYIYNIDAFKEDNKPSFNKKGFTSDDELFVAILDLINDMGFGVVSNDSAKEG